MMKCSKCDGSGTVVDAYVFEGFGPSKHRTIYRRVECMRCFGEGRQPLLFDVVDIVVAALVISLIILFLAMLLVWTI